MTPTIETQTPAPPPLAPQAMTADGVHDTAFQLLRDHLAAPARVADLAAGQGAFSQRLQAAGFQVVAVDAEPGVFQLADVPLVVHDLDQPFAARLGAGGFDACAALEILEHVHDPCHFLRECRALLHPGGLLVLSTPNVESVASRLLFLWNGRLRYFTADETHHVTPIFGWLLQRGLDEAGFDVLRWTHNRQSWDCGQSLKARLGGLVARALAPVLHGEKLGEIRVLVARARGI